MKKFIFIIICLYSQFVFSNTSLFNKVQQKLKIDPIAFEQFQYLGTLHCIDKYLMVEKNGSFYQAYLELDLSLSPITRLFNFDDLDNAYKELEQNITKVKRDSPRRLDFNNYVEICRRNFHSNNIHNYYSTFILNKKNYIKEGDPETLWEKEDIEQNMKDYLEYGKIDYRRFL
ncbi:hypothetical protein [Rodentibacter rarus]|nr:hypothetical protein [Rodentibacter rarus]